MPLWKHKIGLTPWTSNSRPGLAERVFWWGSSVGWKRQLIPRGMQNSPRINAPGTRGPIPWVTTVSKSNDVNRSTGLRNPAVRTFFWKPSESDEVSIIVSDLDPRVLLSWRGARGCRYGAWRGPRLRSRLCSSTALCSFLPGSTDPFSSPRWIPLPSPSFVLGLFFVLVFVKLIVISFLACRVSRVTACLGEGCWKWKRKRRICPVCLMGRPESLALLLSPSRFLKVLCFGYILVMVNESILDASDVIQKKAVWLL